MRRGRERKISGAIGRLVADIAPVDPIARLAAAWPVAVGDAVAAQTAPTSISGTTLTVGCVSGVWAQEVELLSRTVIERLSNELPDIPVKKLRCVVSQGGPARG